MIRSHLIILAVSGFVFQGCAPLEYLDGSSNTSPCALKKVTFASPWASAREVLLDDVATADFGDYPANIRGIIKAYFKDNFGVTCADGNLEIRKPKKYLYRTNRKADVYCGYATKVIIEDNKEFLAIIRDNTVLDFGLWDFSVHGSEQFEKLPTVEVISDEFNGYTLYAMKENEIGRPAEDGCDVELNLQSRIEGGKALCSLMVAYRGSSWLFIEPGESLVLFVDGERMAFSRTGRTKHGLLRDTYGMYTLTENAPYNITYEQLNRIVSASKVEVELVGSRFTLGGFFTEDNFFNFRTFNADHVQNASLDY